MEIRESDMLFSFHDGFNAIKFDDELFYRENYNAASGTKGIDIIADGSTALYFIEIKNCEGTAENQDAWRRRFIGTRNMDTLAEEIALKVCHTCACLAGVSTYGDRNNRAVPLMNYASALHAGNIAKLKKKLFVILFLEGDFSCQSRTNKQIYGDIRSRINKRLKWLNCHVDVVSTQTYNPRDFEALQQRRITSTV